MVQIEGPWSPEEDDMLDNLVKKHGFNWSLISKSIPGRSGDSCWLRWISLESPFTPEEDETILLAHERFGNNWKKIKYLLSGRTKGEIEYRWLALKCKSSLMTNEDTTIGAHDIYIPPPSFNDIGLGQGSSYIHDGNLSHEVGGALV